MSELKTKPTLASVDNYIEAIDDPKRRDDANIVLKLMREITKTEPVMWGESMVGFGTYHYKYASGQEGDWFRLGFAARKTALTLYGLIYYDQSVSNEALLEKLGSFKRGKGCLYIKSLSQIDMAVLRQMIEDSFNHNPKVT